MSFAAVIKSRNSEFVSPFYFRFSSLFLFLVFLKRRNEKTLKSILRRRFSITGLETRQKAQRHERNSSVLDWITCQFLRRASHRRRGQLIVHHLTQSLDTSHLIPVTWYQSLDTSHLIPVTWYQSLDTSHLTFSFLFTCVFLCMCACL